jgi:hypothetical protein
MNTLRKKTGGFFVFLKLILYLCSKLMIMKWGKDGQYDSLEEYFESDEVPQVLAYLKEAAERNADRFSKL